MKIVLKFSFIFVMLLSLNSCFVSRTTVGDGPIGKSKEAVKFSKKKQLYVLWGLMALKQKDTKVPMECGYQIKTQFNVIDGIVSFLTAGIFSMRTEKVLVRKDSQCDPAIRKLQKQLQKKENQEGR